MKKLNELYRTRRRWVVVVVGGGLLLAGTAIAAVPASRAYGGWFQLLPPSVRIVAWPWLPDHPRYHPNLTYHTLSDRQKRLVCWRARSVLRGDFTPAVRQYALLMLVQIDGSALGAEPEVLAAMSDSAWFVRSAASHVVASAGMDSEAVLDEVASIARSDLDARARAAAVDALASVGGDDGDVIETFVSVLGDPVHGIGREAASALASRGENGARALGAVILGSSDEDARHHAVQALSEVPEWHLVSIADSLVAALADPHPAVSLAAEQHLERAGPWVEPYLLGALEGGKPDVRERVCWVLARRDPPFFEAIVPLHRIAEDGGLPSSLCEAAASARASILQRTWDLMNPQPGSP